MDKAGSAAVCEVSYPERMDSVFGMTETEQESRAVFEAHCRAVLPPVAPSDPEAGDKKPRRGRPLGSKNKPKAEKQSEPKPTTQVVQMELFDEDAIPPDVPMDQPTEEDDPGNPLMTPDKFIADCNANGHIRIEMGDTVPNVAAAEDAIARMEQNIVVNVTPATKDIDVLRLSVTIENLAGLKIYPMGVDGKPTGDVLEAVPGSGRFTKYLDIPGTYHLVKGKMLFVTAGLATRIELPFAGVEPEFDEVFERMAESLRARNRRLGIKPFRLCPGCGVLFMEKRPNQIFHEIKCLNAFSARKRRREQKEEKSLV